MTTASPSLDDIRRDIDRIDDAILALLAERAAATGRVKAHKSGSGTIVASPIRPAREAAILRRLLAKRDPAIAPDLLVRLWRTILVHSTLSQAQVRLHAGACDLGARLILNDHFGAMPVIAHGTATAALQALGKSASDIAAIPAASEWSHAFLNGIAGPAQVIATLPIVKHGATPALLVFGHTEPVPSGGDVTILTGPGPVPNTALELLWHVTAAGHTTFALPGFLPGDHAELRTLAAAGFGIAGRCPSPIEVS
jgi:chorismate mutase